MNERALDARLVLPAVAAWVTAWQGRLLPPSVLLVAAGVAAAGGAVLVLRGRTVAAAVAICAAAGAVATAAHGTIRTSGPVAELAAKEAAVVVTGTLLDDPRQVSRQGRELVVARVRVEHVSAAGRAHEVRVPVVVLSADLSWLPLLPSQRVRLEGRLRPAGRGDDVAALLSARGPPSVLSPASRVQRVAGYLRSGLRQAVAPLPAAEQGLLPGLVVGDVSRLDPELREDFRTTGMSHLVAVSGTNVAVVVGAVLLLSRALGLGLRGASAASAVALAGFVVLARPSPSVLRASVMGVVGLVALVSGSRRAALPALSAAVLVLVLLAPGLAAEPGFALSVLATAGLLVLAPSWRPVLARRMPRWLADAIAVPAAAQVACGPVIVAISGTLGLLSVPANLLAVPAVAPATVLGVLAALLAPLSMTLAQAVSWLAYLPTAWLVRIARTGAAVPGAGVSWPAGMRGALLLLAVTVTVLLLLRRAGARRALAAGCAGSLVALGAVNTAAPAWPPAGWFLVACDVGQGDAIAIRAGPGRAVLVDAGPDPRTVDRCLRRLDVNALPLVVLTHPHDDHVLGLPGVLRRPVGQIQVGPLDPPAGSADRVTGVARTAGVPVVPAGLGEVRSAGRARWQVLAPTRQFRGTDSDPNNASLVLRVEVAGLVVLLTGDVEAEAQRALLATGAPLKADVLKVPHHGSRKQEPAFLAAVAPRVTLTSVGADNSFGHPARQTLSRLVSAGARSFRTDRDGDVALVEQGGVLRAVGAKGSGEVGAQIAPAAPGLDPPEQAQPRQEGAQRPARPSIARTPDTAAALTAASVTRLAVRARSPPVQPGRRRRRGTMESCRRTCSRP